MIFQLKIQIRDIDRPVVWRRIRMSTSATFSDLHKIIQAAFGWKSYHLYSFSESGLESPIDIQDMRYADNETSLSLDAGQIKLWDIFKCEGRTFIYVYDFGDEWNHEITLEKMIDKEPTFPVCAAGKGKCPPEDCGGTHGFADMKKAINDPTHPEYKENRKWLGLKKGAIWDVNEFDKEKVNKILKKR